MEYEITPPSNRRLILTIVAFIATKVLIHWSIAAWAKSYRETH